MPPSTCIPRTLSRSQQLVRPSLHGVQTPQFTYGSMAQRSPTFISALVRSYFDHLARQFVPQHAGIGIGRVTAGQGMEIAATHSDAADSNKRVLASRLGGSNLSFNQLAGRL